MSKRKQINNSQRKRLLEKNANVCCICKARGYGVNLHHIDGDPSNNNDGNIAVLCVKDHDDFHRPNSYTYFNHMDLTSDEIADKKKSWEAFVQEAKKENPKVVAVLTTYGEDDNVIGIKVVYQWLNEKIEFERKYQMLDGPFETWLDDVIEHIKWLGTNMKLVVINNPQGVEYCHNTNTSMSTIMDENKLSSLLLDDWKLESLCSIYINPKYPSIALIISYKDQIYYEAHIRKDKNKILLLDNKNERHYLIKNKPSIRTQVSRLVSEFIQDWNLENILIGIGDVNDPKLIDDFLLPKVWEYRGDFKQ